MANKTIFFDFLYPITKLNGARIIHVGDLHVHAEARWMDNARCPLVKIRSVFWDGGEDNLVDLVMNCPSSEFSEIWTAANEIAVDRLTEKKPA